MAKALLALFALAFLLLGSSVITIVSMIWGWGLTPKSWPIILSCVVGHWAIIGLTTLIQVAIKEA